MHEKLDTHIIYIFPYDEVTPVTVVHTAGDCYFKKKQFGQNYMKMKSQFNGVFFLNLLEMVDDKTDITFSTMR